jgi:MoaA/NifB/PqqE/SkfB family radical SAM enzyme
VVIVWRVTERCNLGCGFCGYDRALARPRRDAKPGAVLAFGEVLAAYQSATGDRVLVSWLGGEPLLWRPLAGLTAAFTGLGLRVSTTTNGSSLASTAMRGHLLEHYAELTVSVDGFASFHDEARRWKGGFAAVRRGVSALAGEKRRAGIGPRLRANVVLMRDNVGEFPALCAEMASWGIEEVTFNQLGGNDRPEFYPAHRLLPAQIDALAGEMPALRARLASVGVRVCGDARYLERIRSTAAGRRLPVHDCDPGAEFLFIAEDGTAAPCSFTGAGYGIPIETLRSVPAFLDLRARFAAARNSSRLAVCDDCPSTHVFAKFACDADDA